VDPRRAYRSACDRNVPVVLRTDAEFRATPSPKDAQALVCLDYLVRCTGWLCPLFSVEEPGDQPGRADARLT
jgi:hypothetical protein